MECTLVKLRDSPVPGPCKSSHGEVESWPAGPCISETNSTLTLCQVQDRPAAGEGAASLLHAPPPNLCRCQGGGGHRETVPLWPQRH